MLIGRTSGVHVEAFQMNRKIFSVALVSSGLKTFDVSVGLFSLSAGQTIKIASEGDASKYLP